MIGSDAFSKVLLVTGVILLVIPALFPVQSVLVHDTTPRTSQSGTQLENRGYEVIAYENLSERGQELYVRTLGNGGVYTVPIGEGAPDFEYVTDGELGDASNTKERNRLEEIVIKRPLDSDLPQSDESTQFLRRIAEENMTTEEERRTRYRHNLSMRFDLIETRTTRPPPQHPSNVQRLLIVCLGIVTIAVGGYLRSKPRRPLR